MKSLYMPRICVNDMYITKRSISIFSLTFDVKCFKIRNSKKNNMFIPETYNHQKYE